MNLRAPCVFVFILALLCSCKTSPPVKVVKTPETPTDQVLLEPEILAKMDASIEKTIADKQIPGAVLWVEHLGQHYSKSYGKKALLPVEEEISRDTIFDLASLTKVVATTPSVMLLVERGKVQLDRSVRHYIPEFGGGNRDFITVRHLLTHTSGLRPGLGGSPLWSGYLKGIDLACGEMPETTPGTAFRYSDINFILLGEIVHRVSGNHLDIFAEAEIFKPLGMVDTGFRPPSTKFERIAPTELIGSDILRGLVHDPTARKMGGVAGHAGLFGTVRDLSRFCRMMLNQGELEGVRLFKPETVRAMTSVQTGVKLPVRRGLGWDIDSLYSRPRGGFPRGSYGHTGFTGTSVWIDPFSKSFWILLTSRLHPNGKGLIGELQIDLGNLAAQSIRDFDFTRVAGELPVLPPLDSRPPVGRVANGIDVLARNEFAELKGLRLGLITNHTGKDRPGNSTVDLLRKAPGLKLQAIFSPEHGLRGDKDEKIKDGRDEASGLPVYSLYGDSRTPSDESLAGLDALVFDIQDIGTRFYTYISTLGLCLEAAGKHRIKFFVLDRVNPINAATIEGPVYAGPPEFIAYHALPVRHGMTVGELARMFNEEKKLGVDLKVIAVEGWKRDQWFDQTDLPWRNTSPNIRNLTAAILYPGLGLLEFTKLSVGRGTDKPFEQIGAPYIDGLTLVTELNRAQIPGVRFSSVAFTPQSSVFKGQLCHGVSVVLLNRDQCPTVTMGLTIAQVLYKLYPQEFDLPNVNKLLKSEAVIQALKSGEPISSITALWTQELNQFKARRRAFLIY